MRFPFFVDLPGAKKRVKGWFAELFMANNSESHFISCDEIVIKTKSLYLNSQIHRMNRIKEVLEEKALTQAWLSQRLGKSYNMVNSYVQNRRQPSIEVLFEIGRILKVSPKELLEVKTK